MFIAGSAPAVLINNLTIEKGPPGGPFLTYNPCSASVLIGEQIRITATIFNNTGKLDYSCVNAGMDPGNSCDSCTIDVMNRKCQNTWDACYPNCVNSFYYFYQNKPLNVGNFLYPMNPAGSLSGISATPLPFVLGTTTSAWVEWVFEATATDKFDFNFFVSTQPDGVCKWLNDGTEGTSPPFGASCGVTYCASPWTTDIFGCGGITIVSPFSASTTAYVTSFGTRPVGVAYIEDNIEEVTGITNVGLAAATITPGLACGWSNESPGSLLTVSTVNLPGGCVLPEVECGTPALPAIIPGSGGSASFTWNYSVTGDDGSPGGVGSGGLFFGSRIKGTNSASTTLIITPAPMVMAVTLFVDPDGVAGPLPAVPLGPDLSDSTRSGYLYYMAAETLQVRATMTNQSAYTYEIHPIAIADGRSSLKTYELVSGPAIPVTMPAGAGNTKSFTWIYKANITGTLMGDCAIQPDPQDLGITVQDRGLLFSRVITVTAHPFYDASCSGGYVSFNAPDIAFLSEVFPVTFSMRNNANRKVYMARPFAATLFIDDADNAVIPRDTPIPDLPTTWNVGETKSYTWTFSSTGVSSTIMIQAALLWPDSSSYRCVTAASEQPPKCTTTTARVELMAKPDVYVAKFEFTGPSVVAAFDQPIPLEMCLVNSSPTATVNITSFCPKPVPVDSQGIEVDTGVNHDGIIAFNWPSIPPVSTALPVSIAPSASAYFHWNVKANNCSGPTLSAPDFYFGCFNAGWGNNMVRGTPALSLKYVTTNTIRSTIPVTLECDTFTPKAQYSVGQIISVYQVVKNAGQNDATNFSATLLVESNPPGTVKFLSMTPTVMDTALTGVGVCKASPWDGQEVTYRYDFDALSKGYVRFTTTLTAVDSVSLYYKKESTPCGTNWLRIADPGIMEMTVAATPLVTLTRDCTTCVAYSECPPKGENCIKVDMSLKNRGEISLIEVLPSFVSMAPCPTDPVLCPGCDPDLCPGSRTYTGDVSIVPVPDLVPTLLPTGDLLAEKDIRYYSWTFTPTALGCVRFYMQATAKDAATGRVWNPLDYSNCVNIVERRPIEMRLLDPQTKVTGGQEFEVSIEIYNPGYTDVIMRGGEPALIFINPVTGAAITDNFDVKIPTPVTVTSGTRLIIKAKVTVLAGALGLVEIRIPTTSMYAATDAVTGAPVSVVNTGQAKVVDIEPPRWALGPFVPNPFRPLNGPPVTIQYSVGQPANVKIKVYTISGELVKTLWDGRRDLGIWTAEWNGRNSGERVVASGIYILHLESSSGFNEVKKLAVVK